MTLPYSERVRQRLERRLYTHTEAAQAMGVERSYLHGFRSGSRKAGIATLDRIVAWLDEQDALDAEARR